ncbi:MAG: ArsA-related P-loop ATPase [Pseudobdellovibrio sp.]
MVKKAHLITGKGGVGKSLFSAVLAHYFSTQSQSILLTELSEHSFYKDYLDLTEITYKPQPLKLNLDICQWSPEDCLKEYCIHLLKIESLYKLFFENPVSKSLIQIAPGLHELALLGKLTSSPRHHGPEMKHEQIVVDSYATGHFLSLLRAPAALAEAVPFGPMGEQAKSIDACIRNPDFTEIHIVTIAEELPITEAIELYKKLESEFNITPHICLNKISNLKKSDIEDLPASAKESFNETIEKEDWSRSELKKLNAPWVELPMIPELNTGKLIHSLVEAYAKTR